MQVLVLAELLRVIRVEARGRLRVPPAGSFLLLLRSLELGLLLGFHNVEALVVVGEYLEVDSFVKHAAILIYCFTSKRAASKADTDGSVVAEAVSHGAGCLNCTLERYAADTFVRREHIRARYLILLGGASLLVLACLRVPFGLLLQACQRVITVQVHEAS